MNDQYIVDAAKAAHLAYCTLVVALHKHGVLPVSVVVNELGNQIDADMQRDPNRRRNPQAQLYYDTLIQLETHFASLNQVPPPANREDQP